MPKRVAAMVLQGAYREKTERQRRAQQGGAEGEATVAETAATEGGVATAAASVEVEEVADVRTLKTPPASPAERAAAVAQPAEEPEREREPGPPLPDTPGERTPLPDVAAEGKLLVQLLRGVNLKAMDRNGKSDPYVKISLGAKSFRSKVVWKTLDPVWNQTFEFRGTLGSFARDKLHLHAMDKDRGSWSDDDLGRASVELSGLASGEAAYAPGEAGTGEWAFEQEVSLSEQGSISVRVAWRAGTADSETPCSPPKSTSPSSPRAGALRTLTRGATSTVLGLSSTMGIGSLQKQIANPSAASKRSVMASLRSTSDLGFGLLRQVHTSHRRRPTTASAPIPALPHHPRASLAALSAPPAREHHRDESFFRPADCGLIAG